MWVMKASIFFAYGMSFAGYLYRVYGFNGRMMDEQQG